MSFRIRFLVPGDPSLSIYTSSRLPRTCVRVPVQLQIPRMALQAYANSFLGSIAQFHGLARVIDL